MKKIEAKQIIFKLGGTGVPPEYGVEYFTVGIEPYLKVIEEEYLKDFIKAGGSSFKIVLAGYGGGKTHFLYNVKNLAMKYGYVTSYVSLSPTESPLSKMELIYKAIQANLTYPNSPKILSSFYEKGIDSFLRKWYQETVDKLGEENIGLYLEGIKGIESSSFNTCILEAFKALHSGDEGTYNNLIKWLKGEDIDRTTKFKFNITETLDKTTAFRFIRSLSQFVRLIGKSGLILLFDEAERGVSFISSRDRNKALDHLRQIIDECGNPRFGGVMIFYAVPDLIFLLDKSIESYEALRQRISSTLSEINPSGVIIDLDRIIVDPRSFLSELGWKLKKIYETAYEVEFDDNQIKDVIELTSDVILSRHQVGSGYKRIFVKLIIKVFHIVRERPQLIINEGLINNLLLDEYRSEEKPIITHEEEF